MSFAFQSSTRTCKRTLFALLFCWVFALTMAKADTNSHTDQVTMQANAIMDKAEKTGDFAAAAKASDALFDRVVAWAPAKDLADFQTADYTRRLLNQLNQAVKNADDANLDRKWLLKKLRSQPKLSHILVFLVKPQDYLPGVYQIVNELEQKRPQAVEPFASLVAAMAVVHDGPSVYRRHINENTVKSPKVLPLFDYFTSNERRMLFGIKNVPATLLTYVVNETASIPEMKWALAKYAGNQHVGKLFFSIKYDYKALQLGNSAKAVDQHGYSVPNILKYGGVCADQAYFATTVGKSIGVPTAYTTGEAGNAGHAWIGYFENRHGVGVWDFNSGRYKEFQGVRGDVLDPQTRKHVASSVVALTGQLIKSSEKQREIAVAMTDAVKRLNDLSESDEANSWSPKSFKQPSTNNKNASESAPHTGKSQWLSKRRSTDIKTKLALLKAGLQQCPGYAEGWFCMSHLAGEGQMTLAQKQRWSSVLLKLCGNTYPDFVYSVLEPMIATVKDVDDKNDMWDTLFDAFQNRFDLAARIRMKQAAMWRAAHQDAKAGRCYLDVVNRYANAGPFVVTALKGAADILREQGQSNRILGMYKHAWSMIRKPGPSAAMYATNSNWYRVGELVVQEMNNQGQPAAATRVNVYIQQTLGIGPG